MSRPTPPYLLARLAGAQPDVLHQARTDRAKYTAMGGVLLTTAGVAGVSSAFALDTAVGLQPQAAVVAGALWAVVIFNLDRMLIVSMTRQSGWLRNLLTAIPRLALAIVIGAVISVPLVLRIFQPEIDHELQTIHATNVQNDTAARDKAFANIQDVQKRFDDLQAVASGAQQPSVSDNKDVITAQKQVDDARTAASAAAAAAQCELNGLCGTRQPGVGEAYRQAKAEADAAAAALSRAESALTAATAKAQSTISESVESNRAVAEAQLPALRSQLDDLKSNQARLQAQQTSAEFQDEGLLARLGALDQLTANSPSMRAANQALFLLFLLIEVLPVLVKLLSMVGKPTLYDRLLEKTETGLEARVDHDDDVATQIAQHRVHEQVRQGKQATTLLVEKQSEIAKKAIDTWGRIAVSRSDADLARWYARHSGHQLGGAPVGPLPEPAPAVTFSTSLSSAATNQTAANPTATIPTTTIPPVVDTTAPGPPVTVPSTPGSPESGAVGTAPVDNPALDPGEEAFPPVPAQRNLGGGQTYQQFRATAGAPGNNGHQASGPVSAEPLNDH